MRTKSIFNLALKIFGIYFYTQIIFALPQVFALIPLLMNGMAVNTIIISLFYSGASLLIYLFLGWFLTMKSGWITDHLVREDEETTINISSTSILSIAIIFIGGYMLVNEAPNFISQLGEKFYQPKLDARSSFPFLASILKIVIGCWLIYSHRWIAGKIDRAK